MIPSKTNRAREIVFERKRNIVILLETEREEDRGREIERQEEREE